MTVDEIIDDITRNISGDGSANYIQLTESLNTIGGITEKVLGLMVTIVLIGVPLVVSIEIIYMNFPVIQETYGKIRAKSEGRMNTVLGLVIRDARLSIEEANTTSIGTSVNWIYLRRKSKAVFISILTVGVILGASETIIQLIMHITKLIITGFGLRG